MPTAGILLQRCLLGYLLCKTGAAQPWPLFFTKVWLSSHLKPEGGPFTLVYFTDYSQHSPLIIFIFIRAQITLTVTQALASQHHLMVVATSSCLGFQISLATRQSVQAHVYSLTSNASVPQGLALDITTCSHDTFLRQSHLR